jgi:hypothetical protein
MKMKQKEFRALKQVNSNGILYNFFELDLSLIPFVSLTHWAISILVICVRHFRDL